MERILRWSEFAQEGPPPEWPGCPTKPRLELVTKILNGESESKEVNASEVPTTDRPDSDPQILKRLADAHTECEYEMSMFGKDPDDADEPDEPDDPDPDNPGPDRRLESSLEVLSDIMGKDLIPMFIVRYPNQRIPVYAALSRDPRWTGMSPSLPLLHGLDAVISTFRHHRPMLIGAMPSSEYSRQFPTRPEHPAKNRKNVRGIESLVRVLEYHGATPRFRYQQQSSVPAYNQE